MSKCNCDRTHPKACWHCLADRLEQTIRERDEARAWLEAAREEAGRYARALGSVEAVLGLAGDIPLISLADEAQAALKDVAERQREACADQARFYAGLGWDGEKVQEKVLSTPLVTEAGNNG